MSTMESRRPVLLLHGALDLVLAILHPQYLIRGPVSERYGRAARLADADGLVQGGVDAELVEDPEAAGVDADACADLAELGGLVVDLDVDGFFGVEVA